MKIIRLKLVIGECKVNSSLSRVLGQYQINASKFCTRFNNESKSYCLSGLLFYVYIESISRDIFTIKLGAPVLKFLIQNFSSNKEDFYTLSIEQLFDLYLIYCNLSSKLNIKNRNLVKMFLGSINSFTNLKIYES